jgi:hypothetical protein
MGEVKRRSQGGRVVEFMCLTWKEFQAVKGQNGKKEATASVAFSLPAMACRRFPGVWQSIA